MAAGFQAKIADELMDADLSRLTKVIPCGDNTIRRRFAVEYLVIPGIQYTSISHKKKDECEEVKTIPEFLQFFCDNTVTVAQTNLYFTTTGHLSLQFDAL